MAASPINLDKALETLAAAAVSLEGEDFISYTTIVDIHLANAIKTYSRKEQKELLHGLQKVLKDHEALASEIAWDVMGSLLPFISIFEDEDTPASEAEEVVAAATSLLKFCAQVGNSKEVFMTVTGMLGALEFGRAAYEDDESGEEEGEDADGEFEEADDESKDIHAQGVAQAGILLELLNMIQPRIRAKFPSKFLTTSLLGILGMMTRACRRSSSSEIYKLLSLTEEFVDLVAPTLALSTDASSTELVELLLQKKLLQSFVTHLVEVFFTSQPGGGRYAGWASAYDKKVRPQCYPSKPIRPSPAVISLEGLSLSHQHSHSYTTGVVSELSHEVDDTAISSSSIELFSRLATAAQTNATLLYSACCEAASIEVPSEEAESLPTVPEQVDLSPIGSLLLLAIMLSNSKTAEITGLTLNLKIFPEHAKITTIFLSSDSKEAKESVQDAVLFLGNWIFRHDKTKAPSLGDVPKDNFDFFTYLQVYAALSAMSSNPEIRFLSHSQVQTSLQSHPDESTRISYYRDTLEYCPFEELKSVTVQLLKDEILAAMREHTANPPSSNHYVSMFVTPGLLVILVEYLFPDYSEIYEDEDLRIAWGKFRESYSTMMTTAKLYYILWRNDTLREKLGVKNGGAFLYSKDVGDRIGDEPGIHIDKRWTGVIREAIQRFSKAVDAKNEEMELETEDEYAGARFELMLLEGALDDVDQLRKQA